MWDPFYVVDIVRNVTVGATTWLHGAYRTGDACGSAMNQDSCYRDVMVGTGSTDGPANVTLLTVYVRLTDLAEVAL